MKIKIVLTALAVFVLVFCLTGIVMADCIIESDHAVLIDSQTGTVITEKSAYEKAYPASLTKLMSLLIVFEELENGNISLYDTTVISKNASGMDGTQLFLETGEVRTIEELIYATLVESANDAAVALAEAVSGSVEVFVEKMNAKAQEIGLTNTHFANPTGLDEENHYTCAYDVALTAMKLLEHEEIFIYSKTWTKDLYIGKNNDVLRTIVNTNKLIARGDYIDGLKTGFTENAGCCICATGEKSGMRLIAVVLKAPSAATRFEEAEELLNYGFANYQLEKICIKNEPTAKTAIINAYSDTAALCVKDDVYYLHEKNTPCEITTQTTFVKSSFTAPVMQNEFCGEITYFINGEEYIKKDLFIAETYEKVNFITYLKLITEKLSPFKSKKQSEF